MFGSSGFALEAFKLDLRPAGKESCNRTWATRRLWHYDEASVFRSVGDLKGSRAGDAPISTRVEKASSSRPVDELLLSDTATQLANRGPVGPVETLGITVAHSCDWS